jgi:hypothetical protein
MSIHPDLVSIRQLRECFEKIYGKQLKAIQDACLHTTIMRTGPSTDSFGYRPAVFVCERCGAWEHGGHTSRDIRKTTVFTGDCEERTREVVLAMREGPNRYRGDK